MTLENNNDFNRMAESDANNSAHRTEDRDASKEKEKDPKETKTKKREDTKDLAKSTASHNNEHRHSKEKTGKSESNDLQQRSSGKDNTDSHEKQPKRSKSAGSRMRLTTEEQEIIYEMKAKQIRQLKSQNNKLEAELNAQKNYQASKRQHQMIYMSKFSNSLSEHNIKLLMRMYEKKANEAEDKINRLEKDLKESQDLAKRYHDRYRAERSKSNSSGTQNSSRENKHPSSARRKTSNSDTAATETNDSAKSSLHNQEGNSGENCSNDGDAENDVNTETSKPQGEPGKHGDSPDNDKDSAKVNDNDLDDDEAVFKRHISKVAENKSMRMTTPIRLQDVIRKNEVLIQENDTLKREVQRLKFDNGKLVKEVKLAWGNKDQLLHEISTSEAARRDLAKRLEKQQRQNSRLDRSITRQSADWIQMRKGRVEDEDTRRLAMIGPISASEAAAERRTYAHPVKKNVHMPRSIPVEHWAQANKSS